MKEKMTPKELRSAIEAVLFVAGEPVTVDSLEEVFDEATESIETQLSEIQRDYDGIAGGFLLEKTAGGWRFATRAEQEPHLRKFFARQGEGRLSLAALETLAIIAYRQPITAPEISEIRSVNSSAVLRTLLERKMVRIAGRKNVVGSPFLYRTTREFLVHFGLNDIQDLPKLEEFADILGENVGEDILASDSFASESGFGQLQEVVRGDLLAESMSLEAGTDDRELPKETRLDPAADAAESQDTSVEDRGENGIPLSDEEREPVEST